MGVISVVVPVYNEEKGLDIFYKALCGVIDQRKEVFEIFFVNDGSSDGTLKKLLDLHRLDIRIKIINLIRNFGHQGALTAGIDCASGDALILMDVDMEDPPDKICDFLEYWNKGYDVVYAIRRQRKVGVIKRILFSLFHKINSMISDIAMPDASGTFALMDRKVVEIIKKIPEKNRYIPGLRTWVGLRQIGLEVKRGDRYDKKPRVSFVKLIKLAFDSYVSFSTVPLKFASFFGFIFSILSFVGIVMIIFLKLTVGIPLRGWASIIVVILLISGIQLIAIGIIGEYIGRILGETKKRPLYVVKQMIGFTASASE